MDVVANSMGMSNEELADRKQNLKREQKVLLCLLDLSDRFISFFSKESCYSIVLFLFSIIIRILWKEKSP